MRSLLKLDDALDLYADRFADLCDELYWEGNANGDRLLTYLESWAARDNYTLVYPEDPEQVVWEAYRCVEKGLS